MEDYDEFVKEHLLSEDFVAKRLKRLRVLTEPTPEKLLRDLRRHTNHNELRIVESVTSAKNKLQRKYYSKKKLEVQSIDESIDDPVDFDRRLKLFLHRRNKLGLLSFLDSNPPSKKKPDHGMIVESKEFDQLRRIIDPRWKQSSHKRIDCTVIRTQNTSPLKLKR
jgi:hypothetical protein